ncbi:uncharacterized protein LOC127159131 [Labeo rohita]|uniref:uncharacterized protein LOC127159131 n=1 Tax=Labeo rohita TaxID=84645 RepID=UPI0021E2A41A|nr:uncharacterized protein LOC127159131 [Labeo rohita]
MLTRKGSIWGGGVDRAGAGASGAIIKHISKEAGATVLTALLSLLEFSGELVKAELEIVKDNSTLNPEFVQQLIPSVERTALLYHLTFLSLGGFPKLERLIRDQAIETQLLFGSSEAVLLKCVATSSNLVTSLFPILKKAVEKNKPVLAVRYLMKAKEWISDIITKVDDMVKRYDKHNQSLKSCTSDVYQEQKETEEKKKKQSDEINGLKDAISKLELDLKQIVEKLNMNNEQTEKTVNELNDFHRRFANKYSHWPVMFLTFLKAIQMLWNWIEN